MAAVNPIVAGGAAINPTTLVGTGLAGGGILGGLFGKKSSPPDISGLLNTINQAAQRQNQIATNLPGQLQPLNTSFQTGINQATQTATQNQNKAAQDFLTGLGNNQTLQGQDLTKLLTSQAYSTVPQQQEAAREAAAATGGLQRGSAASLIAAPTQQAAQNVEQGQLQLNLQQQQQKAQALSQINQMSDQQISQILGIDKDTANALYSSGRQDLIDEANSLLGISQNQESQTLNAQEFGLSGQIASDAANRAAQQGAFQQLAGLGGTIVGAGLGGPVGAAAGGQIGNSLAGPAPATPTAAAFPNFTGNSVPASSVVPGAPPNMTLDQLLAYYQNPNQSVPGSNFTPITPSYTPVGGQ